MSKKCNRTQITGLNKVKMLLSLASDKVAAKEAVKIYTKNGRFTPKVETLLFKAFEGFIYKNENVCLASAGIGGSGNMYVDNDTKELNICMCNRSVKGKSGYTYNRVRAYQISL